MLPASPFLGQPVTGGLAQHLAQRCCLEMSAPLSRGPRPSPGIQSPGLQLCVPSRPPQSLQIAAFLFTVCHVVIVVQDWFTDLSLYR